MSEIRIFEYCPDEALQIRQSVFVNEQGFSDGLDEYDKKATHFVAYENENAVGTCRIMRSGESYFFGRLAVLSECRGKSIGSQIMCQVEKYVLSHGARRIYLHAQMRAKVFYEKCGFSAYGDIEYEEDYPHIYMEKNLCPKEHFLNLQPQPYDLISRGLKTIELRLYDEKRKNIFVGDKITFTNTQSGLELSCRVLHLHLFDSFKQLYSSLPLDACGYTPEDIHSAHYTDMERYYPQEKQEKYGVVGIEIELI